METVLRKWESPGRTSGEMSFPHIRRNGWLYVDQFVIHTEQELNKGYADLYLEPFVAQYPDIGYGYVVKVKHLERSGRVDESVVAETLRGARE